MVTGIYRVRVKYVSTACENVVRSTLLSVSSSLTKRGVCCFKIYRKSTDLRKRVFMTMMCKKIRSLWSYYFPAVSAIVSSLWYSHVTFSEFFAFLPYRSNAFNTHFTNMIITINTLLILLNSIIPIVSSLNDTPTFFTPWWPQNIYVPNKSENLVIRFMVTGMIMPTFVRYNWKFCLPHPVICLSRELYV